MADKREFRIRPGRIRSTRAQQARPFIAQVLAAAKKAGGGISRSGRIVQASRSRFGHGQRASIQANRLITSRSRGAVVKARVVRHSARAAPLGTHLNYLRREGVSRDGEKGQLFGPETENADAASFAARAKDDRHHFRFIVSPDDALEMADLNAFTRDLVGQMEKDLDTRLDWVAVDHWNTEHPHIHLIVRGVRDGRHWAWGAIALAVGLAVLSPHPQLLQYMLLTTGAFGLFIALSPRADGTRLTRREGVTRLALALGAVLVGFAIGAVQYLPVLEYIPFSPRAGIQGYEWSTSYATPWIHVPEFFISGFTGQNPSGTYWGPNHIKLHSEYLGLPVIALAVLGVGGPRKRLVRWILGIALLFFLIALGD